MIHVALFNEYFEKICCQNALIFLLIKFNIYCLSMFTRSLPAGLNFYNRFRVAKYY